MARLSIPCAATGCTNPGNKACRGSLCQNCCVIACLTALANGQSQSQCKVSSHRKATTTTTPPPPFQPQAPFSSASPTLAIAIPSASTPLPVPSASTAVQIPPASTSSSTTSVSTSSPPLSTQTSGPPLLTLPPHATARVPALPNTWQAMNPEWHATFEKVRDSRKEANARKRNTEEADRDTANRVELLIWRTVAEGPTGFPINLVDYPKIKLSMDKALLALLSPPKANDADSNTPEPEPATHVDVYNPDCGGRWDIWDVNSWCIVDVRLPHILLRVLVDGPVGRRFPASDYIGLPNAILSALEAVLSTPKAKRFRLDSISHTRTPSRHTISSAFPLTPLQLTPPAPLPIGEALSNADVTACHAQVSGAGAGEYIPIALTSLQPATTTRRPRMFGGQLAFPSSYMFRDIYDGVVKVSRLLGLTPGTSPGAPSTVLDAVQAVWPDRKWGTTHPTSFDNAVNALRRGSQEIWDQYLAYDESHPSVMFGVYQKSVEGNPINGALFPIGRRKSGPTPAPHRPGRAATPRGEETTPIESNASFTFDDEFVGWLSSISTGINLQQAGDLDDPNTSTTPNVNATDDDTNVGDTVLQAGPPFEPYGFGETNPFHNLT